MSQIEEGQELNDEVGYLVYNETLIDHFMHPRNVGEIENPDAMAVVGDPTCGDFIRVYIKVEDGKISDFQILNPWDAQEQFLPPALPQNWRSEKLSKKHSN